MSTDGCNPAGPVVGDLVVPRQLSPSVVLRITGSSGNREYLIAPVVSEPGAEWAYAVEPWDSPDDVYYVARRGEGGVSCTCPHFVNRLVGTGDLCKHGRRIIEARRRGELVLGEELEGRERREERALAQPGRRGHLDLTMQENGHAPETWRVTPVDPTHERARRSFKLKRAEDGVSYFVSEIYTGPLNRPSGAVVVCTCPEFGEVALEACPHIAALRRYGMARGGLGVEEREVPLPLVLVPGEGG